MTELEDLKRRIHAVRRLEKTVLLVCGIHHLLLTLSAGILAFLLIDWCFQLPFIARWLGVGLLISIVGQTLRGKIIRPWGLLPDEDDVAFRLEKAFPQLDGRLISLLQLERARDRGDHGCSEDLLESLRKETLRMAAPLDFRSIVSQHALARGIATAWFVLFLNAACLIKLPDYFQALASRLVDPVSRYPTRTVIRKIVLPERIAKGDTLNIRVHLDDSAIIPDTPGVASVISLDDGTTTSVEIKRIEGTVFMGNAPQILNDVRILVSVGDAREDGGTVTVTPRPEVTEAWVKFRYPAYTGGLESETKPLYDLRAVRGSSAIIHFVSSKPLKEALLRNDDGAFFAFQRVNETGRHWRIKTPLAITKSDSLQFRLIDQYGIQNEEPAPSFPVEPLDDQPPIVRLKYPHRDQSVSANARLVLEFTATDDFEVRSVWLVFKLQRAGALERSREEQRKKIWNTGRLVWDLDALDLEPGDEVLFWLEADDYCPAHHPQPEPEPAPAPPPEGTGLDQPSSDQAPPHASRSMDIRLRVLKPEDKSLELQAELEQTLGALRAIRDRFQQHSKTLGDELKKESKP